MRRMVGGGLFLLLLTAACGDSGSDAADAPLVTVRLATARSRPFPITLEALGTVTPRPGHFAQLAAPAAAWVSRVYVAVGDSVRVGAPLVAFDPTLWEADVRRAEAAQAAAQGEAERAARLSEAGIVPRRERDRTKAELARTEADLAVARRTLSMAVLRSPIGGVVSLVNARLNASVDPSQPLVEVVDPSEFDLLFHLSTGAAARVRRGNPVRFSVRAEAGGGGEGTGSVVGLGARVDSIGSVEVRVRVSKVSSPLWAGQSVRARIQVGENPHAVVVPSASVVPAGDALQVFVVDSGGIAHVRPVSVGARTGSDVEILTGLRAGEVVAAEGAFRLQEGARVRRAGS